MEHITEETGETATDRQTHTEKGGLPAAYSECEQQANTGGFLSSLHTQ